MNDSIIDRIADYLLNAGCGDSGQCDELAKGVIRLIKYLPEHLLEVGQDVIADVYIAGDDCPSYEDAHHAVVREVLSQFPDLGGEE